MGPESWRLLRTKSNPTVDDTDFVGTNTAISGNTTTFSMPEGLGASGRPYTGVEVVVVAVDASRVVQARSTATVQLELLEAVDRSSPHYGGSPGDAAVNIDEDETLTATCRLQRRVYFPVNGGRTLAVRITNDASLPGGTSALQIWWRAVSR